jgi:hypothetical protein
MNYKDQAGQFDYSQSIDPADYTATKTGDEVDLTNAIEGSVMIVVNIGAVTTADATHYFTFTVTEASATGGSFSAADSTQYSTKDSWDRIVNATSEANAVKVFNFIPSEPFIKVVATETGTAQALFGATVLFKKRHQPAST